MKTTILFFAFGLLLIIACKKNGPDAPRITGYWKGKYGYYTAYPDKFIGMLFKADGTVRVYANADTATGAKANGTYTLKGDSVIADYVFPYPFNAYQSLRAVTNSHAAFIEGSTGLGPTSYSSFGPIYLGKQ